MHSPTPRTPRPGPLERLLPVLAGLALVGASVGWIRVLIGTFARIDGSTEAWTMAHVQRVHWLGDYGSAALVGGIPNLFCNPLYPALVSVFSRDGSSAMVAGHAISAAALGLAAMSMWGIWRRVLGPWPALASGAAVLLPATVATAAQARYDSLAVALVLAAGWAITVALEDRRLGPWALAGTLVGLAYLSREYLGMLALGTLLLACLLSWRRPRGPLLALVQLCLVVTAVSLVLQLNPLGGIVSLMSYAGQQGRPRPILRELLGPGPQQLALALGVLGWVLAVVRAGPARRLLLVPASFMAPILLFPVFPQQSPQYYQLAPPLVAAGLGGLVAAVPWPWPRRALALVPGLLLLAWSSVVVPRLLFDASRYTGLHSETWVGRPGDLEGALDWSVAQAGDRALVMSTLFVENIDAYAQLRHDRPVGFIFPTDLDVMVEFAPVFEGRDILLVVVDRPPDLQEEGFPTEPEATWQGLELRARAWVIPGKLKRGQDLCRGLWVPRGVCMERDYLAGGLPGMVAGAAKRRRARPALLNGG